MDEIVDQEVPAEGGPVSPADKAAFFQAAFKEPDKVDRRGEKFIKAAERALQEAQEKAGG